jgi:hypothetical protein
LKRRLLFSYAKAFAIEAEYRQFITDIQVFANISHEFVDEAITSFLQEKTTDNVAMPAPVGMLNPYNESPHPRPASPPPPLPKIPFTIARGAAKPKANRATNSFASLLGYSILWIFRILVLTDYSSLCATYIFYCFFTSLS